MKWYETHIDFKKLIQKLMFVHDTKLNYTQAVKFPTERKKA